MSFFSRIGRLFSRKKKEEVPAPAPPQPAPIIAEAKAPEHERLEPRPEDVRKEKICEHCKAPNDAFVSKCWLCKQDI